MNEVPPNIQSSKTFTLVANILVLIVSVFNFFLIVAIGFSHGYAAAMSFDSNIEANRAAEEGVKLTKDKEMIDVLLNIDAITCCIALFTAVLFLILYKRWHQQLYFPTILLMCLAALEVILSLSYLLYS